MKTTVKYLFFIVLSSLIACGVYTTIYSDYNKEVDFSKYKTFAWLPDNGMSARTDSFRNSAYDNDVIRNNAKNYINHDLEERGFKIEVDTPDVLVQLVLLNEKKEIIVHYPPPYYPYNGFRHYPYFFNDRYYYPYYYPYYDYYTYYGWGCFDYYCEVIPPYKQTYVRGTITVNMFDRLQKKLVWTASAEGNIYDPSFIQDDVHPAIHRIMKTFPAKNGKKYDDLYSLY